MNGARSPDQASVLANETLRTLAFFVGATLIFVISMSIRLGPEVADDGAFFLRYAENILRGEIWVWNPGEPPVWGASAPLYPLLVAVPIWLGISSVHALVGTGMALMALALALTALALRARFGLPAAAAFVVLAAFDTGVMYFGGSGLESPLTLLLLALAVWTVLGNGRALTVGLIAGLLMVQKLDLVPVGALLITAIWFRDRSFPIRASVIAGLIAVCWYGFAWIYFGAPVPNSFLTKSLYQDALPKSIDWRWFGSYIFLAGFHAWLLLFSFVALVLGRKVFPLSILLFGLIATHLVAYTIKYPFEPYDWYGMPALFALLALGSIGLSALGIKLRERGASVAAYFVVPLVLVAIVYFHVDEVRLGTRLIKDFSARQEFDRAEAGRWVNANVPRDYRVYTMWGNPAYFSRRYVFDGSFLNRRYEQGDLIDKYTPEILILQSNPGVLPSEPTFPPFTDKGYEVIKVFDSSHVAGMDYFFAVLARRDVVHKISDRDSSVNLMRYVHEAKLGDQFGILKPQGRQQFFIHPGATSPTLFDFHAASFLKDTGRAEVRIEASMAPNVPEEAVKRGGANIRLVVKADGRTLADAIVKVGQPFSARFDAAEGSRYQILVDNNGGADTDWLLLTVK